MTFIRITAHAQSWQAETAMTKSIGLANCHTIACSIEY